MQQAGFVGHGVFLGSAFGVLGILSGLYFMRVWELLKCRGLRVEDAVAYLSSMNEVPPTPFCSNRDCGFELELKMLRKGQRGESRKYRLLWRSL